MKHIISLVVRNNSGVLARVCSLFGRRGFNIDSLSVSTTDDTAISRITIVTNADDKILDQVIQQTKKLEETINVTHFDEADSVCRELILIKIVTDTWFDSKVVELTDTYGAVTLDITKQSMIIELTGTTSKIDGFISDITKIASEGTFRIKNVCRTGITAIDRGI